MPDRLVRGAAGDRCGWRNPLRRWRIARRTGYLRGLGGPHMPDCRDFQVNRLSTRFGSLLGVAKGGVSPGPLPGAVRGALRSAHGPRQGAAPGPGEPGVGELTVRLRRQRRSSSTVRPARARNRRAVTIGAPRGPGGMGTHGREATQREADHVVRPQRLVQGGVGPPGQPPGPADRCPPRLHRHLAGAPLAGRRAAPGAHSQDHVGAVLRAVRLGGLDRGPRPARRRPGLHRGRRCRPAVERPADRPVDQ